MNASGVSLAVMRAARRAPHTPRVLLTVRVTPCIIPAHMPVIHETQFQVEARKPVEVLPFSARAFITCAAAGDMGPPELGETDVREKALAWAGLAGGRLLTVKQEHTHTVLHAATLAETLDAAAAVGTQAGYKKADRPVGDGIVGNDGRQVLGVTVADCMPIYLHDRERNVVAMLHSGWKSTGIVERGLELMGECWGTRPAAVNALLGPAIQGCCYAVDAERARGFRDKFGEGAAVLREGQWYLDLQEANRRLLERAGVGELAVCANCTFCGEGLFSYRREGPNGYRRMLAGIAPAAPAGAP